MTRNTKIQLFKSLDAENKAEYKRRSRQSPKERMKEFAAIQERVWGTKWHNQKIEHVVSCDVLDW